MYRIKSAVSVGKSFQESKIVLREGFRLGKSQVIVQKIARVLSKRTKRPVTVTTYANAYQTSEDKIISYYGHYNHKNLIRFNFLVTSNESLSSIDIWAPSNNNIKPTKTISLNGYNVVQVIDQIADVFTGEFDDYFTESISRQKEDRMTVIDQTEVFLRENPQWVAAVDNGSIDYDVAAQDFLAFVKTKYGSTKSKLQGASFRWNVRKAIEQAPDLQKKVSPVQVPCIQMEDPTLVKKTLILDKSLADLFERIMKSGPAEAFEMLEGYVRKIGSMNKYINGCIAYGKPGTGKTYTTTQVLDEIGANYVMVKGGVGSAEDLLEVLYKYKDNLVIVFDDNDAVFNSENKINIMKIALDSNPGRKLGQGSVIRRSTSFPNPDFDPDLEDTTNDTSVKESDPEFNGRYRRTIPPFFIFESKIIFLSNLVDFPPAILSRVASVEINFSKDEMLEYIKDKYHGTMKDNPDVTDEDRDAVFDFLYKVSPALNDVSFRLYSNLLGIYMSNKEDGTLDNWPFQGMMFIKKEV